MASLTLSQILSYHFSRRSNRTAVPICTRTQPSVCNAWGNPRKPPLKRPEEDPLEWDTPAVVGHEAYLLLALSSVTVEVVGDLLQLLSSETVLGRVAGNRSA